MKALFEIRDGEQIVAVVPEYASGPGWANRPVWVYIRDRTGAFRTECIQPSDHTLVMTALFAPLAAAHSGMLREVRGLTR